MHTECIETNVQRTHNIYNELDLQRKKSNIRYYKIHDICIEHVNVANHFSKETIIQKAITTKIRCS
jgi:hypothetical protein